MLIELAERRALPDQVIRQGIRRLLARRLDEARREASGVDREHRIRSMFAEGPIAEAADEANRQHYEAPTELFQHMLGPRMKYSGCLWDRAEGLAEAEEAMLGLTCRRAGVADGQRILDLGCGWGALSLWMAEKYPRAQIVALSNSRTQHDYIVQTARRRGLNNLQHIVANVGALDASPHALPRLVAEHTRGDVDQTFDRILSVEMFEHMCNVERLLSCIGPALRPAGKLFVHIFCHRDLCYRFQGQGRSDWMARHFFTGGGMPPADLFQFVSGPLQLERRWQVSGLHYAQTCRAWLKNLDAARRQTLDRFEYDLLPAAARRQLQRWRMFLMACEELFAFDGGEQWMVSHNLLTRRGGAHTRGAK